MRTYSDNCGTKVGKCIPLELIKGFSAIHGAVCSPKEVEKDLIYKKFPQMHLTLQRFPVFFP